MKSWKEFSIALSRIFQMDEKKLSLFLDEQEKFWTFTQCENFLKKEYGFDLPGESPLVILPSNTPHLFLQEIALATTGNWKPLFYVSEDCKDLKKIIHDLNFEVLEKIPTNFPHVRSYGKKMLNVISDYHVFHGPWYGVSKLSEMNIKSLGRELEGRGCLSPVILYGDEKYWKLLPQTFFNPLIETYAKSFEAVGALDSYEIIQNNLILKCASMEKCYELIQEFNPCGKGVCYFVQNWNEDTIPYPRLLHLDILKKPLHTIPETVIKSCKRSK